MTRWRVLSVLAVLLVTAGATALGVGGAGFRTAAGRAVLVRLGLAVLDDVLDGTVEAGYVGGSFTEGLEARDVVIRGNDGTLLARFHRVVMRYRLADLLSGRIVLGQVLVSEPLINVVKLPNGRFNYQEVLRLGGSGGDGGGTDPLVAFHDAEIRGGRVVIRTPTDDPRPELEIEKGPNGWLRVRRLEGLDARVGYVRIASPFPTDNGLRFDIDDLSVLMTDPGLDIRGMKGRLQIDGDSLGLDLAKLELPGSDVALQGSLRWPGGPLLLDLDIKAQQVAADDLDGLVDPLPWGLVGSGDFIVRSIDADHLSFTGERMNLKGREGGGRVHGRLNMVFGPNGRWTMSDTELFTDTLDIEYLRPLTDTIPLAGRITGRLTGDGAMDLLSLDLDWLFQDSLVSGWPQTRIRGRGVLALGVAGDPVFYGFRVDSADIDLGTVNRLFPVVELEGRLGGVGRLNGEWQNLEYRGVLEHRAADLPTSTAVGAIRLDSRTDTLGLWANLTLDSLNFAGLHPSYATLPQRGAFGGALTLAGYMDSLSFEANLAGPPGIIAGEGELVLMHELVAGRDLDVKFAGLNASGLAEALLPTELYGNIGGSLAADTVEAPRGLLTVNLDSSWVAGSPFDSLRGTLRLGNGLFGIDTLGVWGPGVVVSAGGGLGLDQLRTGTLNLAIDVDSLASVASLLQRVFGVSEESDLFRELFGFGQGRLAVGGSFNDYHASAIVAVPYAVSAGGLIEQLELESSWESSIDGRLAVNSTADSLEFGRLVFSDLLVNVSDRQNALRWEARVRLGLDGSFMAGGRALIDSAAVTVPIDSLGLLLPTYVWFLGPDAVVTARDSTVDLENVTLSPPSGGASVSLAGQIPRSGLGTFKADITALPLADIWALGQRNPNEVGGEINGRLDVLGTARAPIIRGALSLRQGRFGVFQAPFLEGTAGYESGRLVGNYRLWRANDRIFTIDVDLPIDLAFVDVDRRQLAGPLTVRAVADGVDLGFVELVAPSVRDAGGRLDADVAITGTWERPELTGTLSVTEGQATFPGLGVTHRDLDGRLVLSGDTIHVDELSVSSGEGHASVQGFVRLEGLTQPVMNLQMSAEEFDAADVPDFLTLTTSADLVLSGPVFGATLTGQGTVTKGVLYFSDLVEKRIINLEDTLFAFIDPSLTSLVTEEGLGADFENRMLDGLHIDSLLLGMGSEVWLRSNEANIQLTGQVVAGKVGDQYRLDGTLNTPRGTYRLPIARGTALGDFVMRDFAVTDGEVQYFGTPDLDAAIDINAQHVVRTTRGDAVTVFVNVGRTLYSPRLTFTSDVRPALPETEIISYLLFGAPSFQALGQEGERRILDVAASELVGGALSGEIERSLITDLGVPIDYLQISPEFGRSGLTGTEIAVGRQFGSRVFIKVSPRVCPDQELYKNLGVSAEFRLSRHWSFAASNDPVRGCGPGTFSDPLYGLQQIGLDLFWEKRY